MQPYLLCCCGGPPEPGCFYVADLCPCPKPLANAPPQIAVPCSSVPPSVTHSVVFVVQGEWGQACYTLILPQEPLEFPGELPAIPLGTQVPSCSARECCAPPVTCAPFWNGLFGTSVLFSATGFNMFYGTRILQFADHNELQGGFCSAVRPTIPALVLPWNGEAGTDAGYDGNLIQVQPSLCFQPTGCQQALRVQLHCVSVGEYIAIVDVGFLNPARRIYRSPTVFGNYQGDPSFTGILFNQSCWSISYPVGFPPPPTNQFHCSINDWPSIITIS